MKAENGKAMSVRFARGMLWFAGAVCVLLALRAGGAGGQADKAVAHSVANTTAVSTDTGIGLIDVKQGDLLQKQAIENWVSYNGDYTGRRYSGMTQITPANVSRMTAQWVFHTRGPGPLEVTPVVVAGVMFVTSANDALRAGCEDGQAVVASRASHHAGVGG